MVAPLDNLQTGAQHSAVERCGGLADAAAVGGNQLAVHDGVRGLIALGAPGRAHHAEIRERLARLQTGAVDGRHGAGHVIVAVGGVGGGGAVGAELFEILTQIVGGDVVRRLRDGDFHRAAPGRNRVLYLLGQRIEVNRNAGLTFRKCEFLRFGVEGHDGRVLCLAGKRSRQLLKLRAQRVVLHACGQVEIDRGGLERLDRLIALLARAGAAVLIGLLQHLLRIDAVAHVVLRQGKRLILMRQGDGEGLGNARFRGVEQLARLLQRLAAEIDPVDAHALIEGFRIEQSRYLRLMGRLLCLLLLIPDKPAAYSCHNQNRDNAKSRYHSFFRRLFSCIRLHMGGTRLIFHICHECSSRSVPNRS